MVHAGRLGPTREGHVHFVSNLGRQFVKREGRDQANDAVGHPQRDSYQIGVSQRHRRSQTIDAPAEPLQDP